MQAAPQGGIYNYFHSLLPPLSLAPFLRRTPLPSTSLFFKGLIMEICLVVISMNEESLGMYCRIRTFRYLSLSLLNALFTARCVRCCPRTKIHRCCSIRLDRRGVRHIKDTLGTLHTDALQSSFDLHTRRIDDLRLVHELHRHLVCTINARTGLRRIA